MKKIFCDVKNCENMVKITESNSIGITDLEFYDQLLPGTHYCWGRLGIMNADLCEEHRYQALKCLIEKIKDRYNF